MSRAEELINDSIVTVGRQKRPMFASFDDATRIIKELEAQVKNRELQIEKLESAERIRKLDAAIRDENMCSHYRPDCPVHREEQING